VRLAFGGGCNLTIASRVPWRWRGSTSTVVTFIRQGALAQRTAFERANSATWQAWAREIGLFDAASAVARRIIPPRLWRYGTDIVAVPVSCSFALYRAGTANGCAWPRDESSVTDSVGRALPTAPRWCR
jgi:hypothetical protein